MKNFKGEIIIRPKEVDRHTIENIGNSIHNNLLGIRIISILTSGLVWKLMQF